MDQNQTVDNDLQKAIDDITNTTNIDPVFSDPVAAPSSVPEGDTGELGEPIGPFPEPVPEPTPAPMTPPDSDPTALQPTTPPEPTIPEFTTPTPPPTPESIMPPLPTPDFATISTTTIETAPSTHDAPLNMHQVKEAALRDLVPLLNHLDMAPMQKFNIYRNIFENLRDYTVLNSAYHAASEIPDEKERAEALLYLVESIDKM